MNRVSYVATALAQTTGFLPEERQAIIDLLNGGATSGNVVHRIHAAVLTRVGVRDFSWPEFDRWQTFFARQGTFPPLWENVEKVPTACGALKVRHAYQTQKLYLLLDWLFNLETTRTTLARYAKQNVRVKTTRQGSGVPCPVCDGFDRREVRDRSRDLPPFHPGCRCVVLVIDDASNFSPGWKGPPLR